MWMSAMADPNNTCAAFTAMPPYSQLVVHAVARLTMTPATFRTGT